MANRYEELKKLEVPSNVSVAVEEILKAVSSALNKQDKIFFRELDRAVWNYFRDRLPDFRSNMGKSELAAVLDRKGVKPELISKLVTIIHQCETGIYANVDTDINKAELFENLKSILASVDKAIVS